MQALSVSLVQGATRWHDAASNRDYYGDLVRTVVGQCDLVVLPETFLSGFSNASCATAVTMDDENVRWMRSLASEVGAVVCGSLLVSDAGHVFNRLLWMRPDGSYAKYDKRHLFRMAGEHEHYARGHERLLVELNGWRILPQICYDLRFPVWLRNRVHEQARGRMDYDLALFVANWPAMRRRQWRTLLRARAIENLCFVVGVNRIGVDGNGLAYAGDSTALDCLGDPLVHLGAQEQVVTVRFEHTALLAHRQDFPAWMDADAFTLDLTGNDEKNP